MLVVYCYGLLSVGMGGAVSSGESNCELVDNLCNEGYITRPEVERAFRVVDRADYMTFADEGDRLEAYEDHAWRRGSIHISAPCIYTKAVEALE
jgi:protein-L-isoaspartate O-methyltransferase